MTRIRDSPIASRVVNAYTSSTKLLAINPIPRDQAPRDQPDRGPLQLGAIRDVLDKV